ALPSPATEGLRDDQAIALVERETERRGPDGVANDRTAGSPIGSDRVSVNLARRLLGHDELGAVRVERNLGRACAGRVEGSRRAAQWRERAVASDGKAGDVSLTARVQRIQQSPVDGHANRLDAAGGNEISAAQPVWRDLERGDLVAAGVHREQETVVIA